MTTNFREIPIIPSDEFSQTRLDIDRARHTPGYIYSSPEILERDKREIFMKEWICVARQEELPKSGSYMAFRLLNEPVVICRNYSGEVKAFRNMCAHRGVEVAKGTGTARLFMCPYHGWTYDLDGQLQKADFTQSMQDFDISKCKLPSLRVDEWAGNIYICFSHETPPLHEFLKDLIDEYAFFRLEDCAAPRRLTMTFNCNWKLVVENKIDIYHVNVLHRGTIGAQTDYTVVDFDGKQSRLTSRGGVSIHYPGAMGLPGKRDIMSRIPWFTQEMEDWGSHVRHTPNFHLVGRADGFRMSTVVPIAVDKTEVWFWYLFPKSAQSDPAFEEKYKQYEDFVLSVFDEDREMIESLQNSSMSLGLEPGPMARLEGGIHHTLNHYLDRIFHGIKP
jgi:Rieske 2Fe-2S family protein